MLTNKEKNFISAVIYLHNCEKQIGEFIKNVADVLDNNFEKYEIICVNDYSTDNTLAEVKRISNSIKGSLSVINMSFYQGLELAMNAGMDLAIGDFVYEFDSTIMDYSPDLIMKIYRRSLEGFDIVSVGPETVKRKSSRLFYSVYNRFSKTAYKIRTESFRILSRRAINRVNAMSRTIPYRKAFYANCGLKSDIVIYQNLHIDKKKQTNLLKESRIDTAISTIILFTDVAYQFAIILSLIMMLVTIGTVLYTVITFLGHVKPVEGWTTTMLFLSFAFFGLFSISAIIIKYLSMILNLIFKQQKYTIESIEKLNK